MSKTGRTMLQIGLSLVLAIVAGVLVFKWMAGRPVAQAVQTRTVDTVQVAVADEDLMRGAVLTEGMIRTTPYVSESVPSGAFNDPVALIGRVLDQNVGRGEALTESRLAPVEVTVGGVAAMITPGKRAVAVKGNTVLGLSGFVRPGNRVDVLVTLSNSGVSEPITKTVLENILVLATGTEIQANPEGITSSVDVYTLEMTPEESERLALAATQGTLHFALRNSMDSETVLTHGAEVSDALAAYRPERPARAARSGSARAPQPQTTVEIIQGGSRQRVTF